MAKTKTTYTSADVNQFIDSFANTEQKKKDSLELIKIMQDITGESPKMWGPTIIGSEAIIIDTKVDTKATPLF